MSLNTEHELSEDLRELEQQLQDLVPSPVSLAFVGHLEQAMQAPSEEALLASDDFDDLETHLGQLSPAMMPDDILDRMVKAMDRWHEHVPVEEKVVPFGESEEAQQPVKKNYTGGMLAAVATVALLGAVTALVIPHFSPGSGDVSPGVASGVKSPEADFSGTSSPVDMIGSVQPRDAWVEPNALSHKVTNTSDHGIIMTRDNTPHRCIRVDYVDRIKAQDDEGREIEIARPGVNYMLLPVEIN